MFEFGEGNPILVWTPVVEPDLGQERFLTDNPTRLFRLGRFHRVPVMAGITELEFAGPAISKNFYYIENPFLYNLFCRHHGATNVAI